MRENLSLFAKGISYLLAMIACGASITCARADGPVPRLTNTSLQLPASAPDEGYSLVDAYGLVFSEPVGLVSPPGDPDRLFVVERSGRIMVIPDIANPSKQVFLDLSSQISYSVENIELGLLGLAFHPDYANNGYFYVYRTQVTSSPASSFAFHDVLSRFSVSPTDPDLADASSELAIIKQVDASGEHNAGDIKFGPDGYLYLSLGDNGPAGADQSSNPQAIDRGLFGGIIRIDVDKKPASLDPNPHHSATANYAIPPDNPFVGITEYQGIPVDPAEVRTELYAIGFRNPWKIEFDPNGSGLYVADVGGGIYEEVSKVEPGGNHGWPYYEGATLKSTPPAGFSGVAPLVTYSHGSGDPFKGRCVIGGVFYTGSAIPALDGAYLYGDFRSGSIWHFFPGSVAPTQPPAGWLASAPDLACFGTEPGSGDVLVGSLADGKILRLIHKTPAQASPFPQLLSEVGAFSDLTDLTPDDGVVPYDINHIFWSDHAIKTRWFSVPDLADQMSFHATDPWQFPTGTVWVKHFDLLLTEDDPSSKRRLETRFLVKSADGGAYGVTYKWNQAGTDAELVGSIGEDEAYTFIRADGSQEARIWRYPGRAECMQCHTAPAEYALGFSTAQLNRQIDYGSGATDQLGAFELGGYLQNSPPPLDSLERLSGKDEEQVGLTHRAKSYLEANCASCHRPGNGTVASLWDARMNTPPADMKIFDRLIAPGDQVGSFIHTRINTRADLKMPPIGSLEVDDDGVALIRRWINAFPSDAWTSTQIGQDHPSAGSSIEADAMTVSSAGSGISATADEMHFLSRSATSGSDFVVRLDGQYSTSGTGKTGLMVRGSSAQNSAAFMIGVTGSGVLVEDWRGADGEAASNNLGPGIGTFPVWLRAQVSDDHVSSSYSMDGTNWTGLSTDVPVQLGDQLLVGLASNNPSSPALNTGNFSEFKLLSVALEPILPLVYTAPDHVDLAASVDAINTDIATVRFLAGAMLIGEVTTPPYEITWSEAPAGIHAITAEVVDSAGTVAVSDVVLLEILAPDAELAFAGSNSTDQGDWIGVRGGSGHAVASLPAEIPDDILWTIASDSEASWDAASSEPSALEIAGSSDRVASRWQSASLLSLDIDFTDGEWHELALYFLDWTDAGLEQVVTVKAADGTVIGSQMVSDFAAGKYLSWELRGRVIIEISGKPGDPVVLSGLFIDDVVNAPPSVSITSPTGTSTLVAPHPIVVTATADDPDGTISSVEFVLDGVSTHTDLVSPYSFDWLSAVAGTHSVFARATDDRGRKRVSEKIEITVRLPISSAVFVAEDNATQGDWIGNYGADGYMIMNHATQLPSDVSVERIGGSSSVWGYPALADKRGLLQESGTSRIIAPWYHSVQWSMDVRLEDGEPHRFTIYTLDWNQADWQGRVRVIDPATGSILDEREINQFASGRYLSWVLRGDVRFVFESDFGHAMVAGVFLDPAGGDSPSINLVRPFDGSTHDLQTGAIIEVDASVGAGSPTSVELFEGSKLIATLTSPPFTSRWIPGSGGMKELTARAFNGMGRSSDTLPIQVSFTAPTATAAAVYQGEDVVTQGDWPDQYGEDGYVIPGHSSVLQDFASFDPGRSPFIYLPNSGDVRAVAKPGGGRIASTWAGYQFTTNLELMDGRWHEVALYFLDWDSFLRAQSIEITDAGTGAVLDQRNLASFHDGKYLIWNLRGNVNVSFDVNGGVNALLNGVFFQPLSAFRNWQLDQFSPAELADALTSGATADPDNDGLPNLLEYKLGTDPRRASVSPLSVSLSGDDLMVEWDEAVVATDVNLQIEVSTDLQSWVPATILDESRILEPESDRVSVQIERAGSRFFVRLNAG